MLLFNAFCAVVMLSVLIEVLVAVNLLSIKPAFLSYTPSICILTGLEKVSGLPFANITAVIFSAFEISLLGVVLTLNRLIVESVPFLPESTVPSAMVTVVRRSVPSTLMYPLMLISGNASSCGRSIFVPVTPLLIVTLTGCIPETTGIV